MKILVGIAAVVVIVVVGWIGLRTWYVDTHCTMVLGTQVCSSGSQSPANQSPAPLPQCSDPADVNPIGCTQPPSPPVPSATAATAGYVTEIRPGVWEIDCASGVVQCVPPGRVGAGPDDSTCYFETINGAVSTVWERCRS